VRKMCRAHTVISAAALIAVLCSVSCAARAAGDVGAASTGSNRSGTLTSAPVTGTWGAARHVPGTSTDRLAETGAVSCVPGGECTAVGSGIGTGGFVISERNGPWSATRAIPGLAALSAGVDAVVSGLSCPAESDCLASGMYLNADDLGVFVAEESHGTWHRAMPVPGLAALNTGSGGGDPGGVSCAAPGDCAVAGTYTPGKPDNANNPIEGFVADEFGGKWRKATPIPGLNALNGDGLVQVAAVSCPAPGDCVVAGDYTAVKGTGNELQGQQGFIDTESDGTWGRAREVPGLAKLSARGFSLITALSCPSARHCVAVGDYRASGGGYDTNRAFATTWSGGAWSAAAPVAGVTGLATLTCTNVGDCLAGGSDSHQTAAVIASKSAHWGSPAEIPGARLLAYRNKKATSSEVETLACPSAGNCSAGGTFRWGATSAFTSFSDSATQVFITDESGGTWGTARVPTGLAALNTLSYAGITMACSAPAECAAGGAYGGGKATAPAMDAFVMTETPAKRS
jgi:hypothetical protein